MNVRTTYLSASAAACLLTAVGIALGCVASDFVALTGFPHKKYLVEVAHDSTPHGAYMCQRASNAYGPELSLFNEKLQVQDRCILEVTGTVLADGSMKWYPGYLTWYGRFVQGHPPSTIPAAGILSIKPR